MTPFRIHVISHTHWDREWYASFQEFRYRLVRVVDQLLDILQRDPAFTHFNLDGQAIVLKDYLEIRPERAETLRAFIQSGRIGAGPWFVLPDEFLVSGEALVRNLQLGCRTAGDMGRFQKAGYIPDTFGHIAQLPQILRGFGLDTCMHFRGLDESGLKSELWWEFPDGSRVLLHHLPNAFGYVNAAALPEDVGAAAADLQSYARYEEGRASGNVLLAMNGVDHLPVRADLPAVLAEANRLAAGRYQFIQSSLEDFFADLYHSVPLDSLQVVKGELRQPNRTPGLGMLVLPHILSSRIYLKMMNERVQNLLERWAEPWSAIAWAAGENYPDAFLRRAWEYLLENHPHDSIGGCSVDPVHAQMETRFAWASELGGILLEENFAKVASNLDLSGLEKDEVAVVVYNALPFAWEGAVEANIDISNGWLNRLAWQRFEPMPAESSLGPQMEAPQLFRWRTHFEWGGGSPPLPDAAFRGLRLRALDQPGSVEVQVKSISRTGILNPLESGPRVYRDGLRTRVAFHASLPAMGYRVFAARPEPKPNRFDLELHPHNVLENEHLRVEIASNGTFSLIDKVSGEMYTDLGYFEDGGDCGDGYNYSEPAQERLYTSLGSAPRICQVSPGPVLVEYRLDYDLSLPAGLDDFRRSRREEMRVCQLSVTLRLSRGSRRLELDVRFDNHVDDHRLRMIFPSDVCQAQSSHSAMQFDVVERPLQIEPVPSEAWLEDAPRTFPQHGWLDIASGARGLAVFSLGLPEYEVRSSQRREVAITLLRAVGFLGSGNEAQAFNHGAGPNIATPEGQIQRRLEYHLALYPHAGNWAEAEVWRQAQEFSVSPRSITHEVSLPQVGTGPLQASYLVVEGRNVILSAVKKAEMGEVLIVRLYNPSNQTTQGRVLLPFVPTTVCLARLDEHPLPDSSLVPEPGNWVKFELLPGKIVTLWVKK